MSEEEGGAEDVSFLRTEDMVTLSCTGTGERVCLSAEGFGNRQCFLESIADKVSTYSYNKVIGCLSVWLFVLKYPANRLTDMVLLYN